MVFIKAVLVHGFNKSSKDMRSLKKNLELLGYHCFSPDLQLTYKEFEYASFVLEGILEEIIKFYSSTDEKIHLIGHSTGGLVIRKLIADTKYIENIGRCILVATPNNGCKLADIASNFKPYVEVYKTLKSLSHDYINKLDIKNKEGVEMAAIAGSRNNLLLGNLIGAENDGRVEVESVYIPSLKDFLVLPYGHKEIHYQEETAKWIDVFIRTGKFNRLGF